MANPFQSMLNGSMPGPVSNIQQMVQAFQQFKSNFQGDPKQKVEELLQSGRINQTQLNQIQQMAQNIAPFFK